MLKAWKLTSKFLEAQWLWSPIHTDSHLLSSQQKIHQLGFSSNLYEKVKLVNKKVTRSDLSWSSVFQMSISQLFLFNTCVDKSIGIGSTETDLIQVEGLKLEVYISTLPCCLVSACDWATCICAIGRRKGKIRVISYVQLCDMLYRSVV